MNVTDQAKDADTIVARAEMGKSPARWYALAILTITYLIAQLDRQVIVIASEPIKHEFGLSDTQLGFLTGTCFALAYALAGIPMGMAIDRFNRKNLLAGAVTIWSVCTALGGLAQSYWHLIITRALVGAAEAPNNTTGYSLVTDFFRWEERSRAMGIYTVGSALGALVGLGFGGWVTQELGWRMALLVAGVPGLIIALLLYFTIREPERRGKDGTVDKAVAPPPLMTTVKFIWSQRSLVFLYGGFIIGAMTISGLTLWLPSYFVRVHGVSLTQLGLYLGITFGIAATSGGVLGGLMGDYIGKKSILGLSPMVGVQMIVVTLAFLGMLFVDNLFLAFSIYAIGLFAHYAHHPPIYSMMQILVQPRMRGLSSSILLVGSNLIGFGLGPQLIGVLSDWYAPWAGVHSIQYAIATMILMNIFAIICFFLTNRTLKADLAKVT